MNQGERNYDTKGCNAWGERGGCHLNGNNIAMQTTRTMLDTIGLCFFPALEKDFDDPTLDMLSTITGREYDKAEILKRS